MELLKNTNFDFISKHRSGFVISAVVIVIGLVFLVIHQGPNFGIDFRGGVKIQAKFNRAVTEAELQAKLTEIGYERVKIQIDASKNEAFVSMGYRPEFQQQLIDIPIMTDPGDATAIGLQVSRTAPKAHLLEIGESVQLIDGSMQQRNEIIARDDTAEDGAIQLTFAKPFGIDLSENATIQVQASVGRILTDVLLEGDFQSPGGWQALAGGVNISEVGRVLDATLNWRHSGRCLARLLFCCCISLGDLSSVLPSAQSPRLYTMSLLPWVSLPFCRRRLIYQLLPRSLQLLAIRLTIQSSYLTGFGKIRNLYAALTTLQF